MILVPAISPAGNWPEPDLIGAKMAKNRPKWAGNGPETGRDEHVSLQTGGKHERACFKKQFTKSCINILTGMPLVPYILIE